MKTTTTITIIKILLLPILAAAALCLGGCASLLPNTGAKRSTSVVEFLYPNRQPFVEPSIPTLSLPMRVGVAFVPALTENNRANPQMPEATKNALMRAVSDQFKKLPYVRGIELVPTQYLRAGGSFENLDQLRSLLGIDVVVLLAYDQQQNTTDTPLILSYWTIVGAYTVPAQKNSTSTLMDAAVYDIASRKMLFRAAGVDVTNHRSTAVGTTDQLVMDSGESYKKAAASLGDNLQAELESFKVRIKESPEEVKVVAKPGYNLAAGALDGWEVAAMALFAGAVLVAGFMRGRGRERMVQFVMILMCAGIAFGSTGCVSTVVLSAGKTEGSVFKEDPTPATRSHIERKIGVPKETRQLDTVPQLSDFRALSARYQKELVDGKSDSLSPGGWLPVVRVYLTRDNKARGSAGFYDPGMSNMNNEPLGGESVRGPISYVRYVYRGRIVPGGLQGAYFRTGLCTWGIAEPLLIPLALLIRVTPESNYIDVWYDATGYVLAYSWSLKPHESVVF